jgi:hypothetical protein
VPLKKPHAAGAPFQRRRPRRLIDEVHSPSPTAFSHPVKIEIAAVGFEPTTFGL